MSMMIFLQIIIQFEPIHPYVSLPHLLALFSIVKIFLFQEQILG